jgi:peptidoglycan-associated lipoprotein
MRNLLLVAFIAAALVGCSTTPTTEAPIEDKGAAGATAPGAGGAVTGGAQGGSVSGAQSGAGGLGADELRNPNSILSKRSIYFDFDSFVVKDEYRPLVEAHARYLQSHANARMTIQGNTDERGSREYNLALGQKRAEAVAKSLTLLGASASQVEAVSFGKERPAVEGHDEASWAKNRRAEIAYR